MLAAHMIMSVIKLLIWNVYQVNAYVLFLQLVVLGRKIYSDSFSIVVFSFLNFIKCLLKVLVAFI